MKEKARKKRENNIESRLKDCKDTYDFNQEIIERLLKDIAQEELVVKNGNNTESASPHMRMYMDLTKTQMQIRKQINDMELIKQDGKIKSEEEANPFE